MTDGSGLALWMLFGCSSVLNSPKSARCILHVPLGFVGSLGILERKISNFVTNQHFGNVKPTFVRLVLGSYFRIAALSTFASRSRLKLLW